MDNPSKPPATGATVGSELLAVEMKALEAQHAAGLLGDAEWERLKELRMSSAATARYETSRNATLALGTALAWIPIVFATWAATAGGEAPTLTVIVIPPAVAIAALVFGYMATSEIKKSQGRIVGRGRAITAITIGWIEVVLSVFVLAVIVFLLSELARCEGNCFL